MHLPAFLLTALLLFTGLLPTTFAQDAPDGTLSGTVYEDEAERPLVSATVALHSARDSSLVTGTLTDADGTFRLEQIRPGDYFLRVSFVGYLSQTVPDLSVTPGRHIDLGSIYLREDTAELDEVQVSAEREYMEVGIDRTVYNTGEQPVTAGGSAQDVLANIPSVEIDLNGNISLRGSQSVAVYLNGKPAPMSGESLTSFLAGLAAENIERVEVIPNPSARYDPEGTSGILNIVLARDVDRGWGGSLSGNVNTRGHYGGTASTNYGRGPWSLYANYSLRYSVWDRAGWRFRENRYLDPLTFLRQEMTGEGDGRSHNLNTSVDYQVSDRSTLSLSAMLSRRTSDGDELNEYIEMDAHRDVTERYTRTTDGEDTDLDMDYRLSFQHVVEPRTHELSVEARYEAEGERELERYVERVLPLGLPDADGVIDERQAVEEDAHEREASVEVDYTRPLSEAVRLELGYDGEQEWVDERFYSESLGAAGVFVPDADLNNTFTYAEQTHSAYGILGGRLGPFGAQLGVRLEAALTDFDLKTTGETFDNNYFSVFPSLHLSYELNPQNTFKVSYSKRVRRPSEWQLNPFGDYDDPTSIRRGNPYLTPEYTHSGEVSYSHLAERYTLTLSPYVRYTVDEISWHETITDEGVTILSFENFDTETSYGTELIGSLTLGDWLKGNASLNAYKQVTQAGSIASELSNDALGFRTRLSATAELRPGLQLQVSQSYRSPMEIPGGRIDAWTQTDLALQQSVLSGRGSLNLRVHDLFGAPNELIERDMERYYQEYYQERNTQGVQVSFRYTFSQGGEERGRGGWRGRGRGRY